jgi:hypothetical protein
MLTYHGTKKNNLSLLTPQYYEGSNGSQDGVGVNLTQALMSAQEYAGEEGRILLVHLNTAPFLTIDARTSLSLSQCQELDHAFSQLPSPIQQRLATDINGRETTQFPLAQKEDAHVFYKEARAAIKKLPNSPDRLLPKVDFTSDGIEVHTARQQWDLTKTTTAHLHYILTLCDNALASDLLKKIADGLILPKNSDTTHYLSFRDEEVVLADFSVKQTHTPSFAKTVEQLTALSAPQWLSLLKNDHNPVDVATDLLKHPIIAQDKEGFMPNTSRSPLSYQENFTVYEALLTLTKGSAPCAQAIRDETADKLFLYAQEIDPSSTHVDIQIDRQQCLVALNKNVLLTIQARLNEWGVLADEVSDMPTVNELRAGQHAGYLFSAGVMAQTEGGSALMIERDEGAPTEPFCWQFPAGRCEGIHALDTAKEEVDQEIMARHHKTDQQLLLSERIFDEDPSYKAVNVYVDGELLSTSRSFAIMDEKHNTLEQFYRADFTDSAQYTVKDGEFDRKAGFVTPAMIQQSSFKMVSLLDEQRAVIAEYLDNPVAPEKTLPLRIAPKR